MKNDHKMHFALMVGIIFFELVMLLLSLLSVDASANEKIENSYRFLYVFIIAISFICLILTNYFWKKNKTFQYYIFIGIFMFAVMLWGAGISILLSHDSFSLMYYALAMVACSALICIEPWVSFLCVLVSEAAYISLYYILDGIQRISPVSFYLGVVIAVLLVSLSFYFNFQRRVEALDLQITIGELNEELAQQAYMDDLTKAYNRSYLTENIDKPLTFGEKPSAVMMIDVDLFKDLNDKYGHQVGDACLKEAGRLILESIKDEDGYVVRYGGDEFLVYLNSISKEHIIEIANALREKVEKNQVKMHGGISTNFTISAGIAFAHDNISYHALINEADDALYESKKKRNLVSTK